MTLEVILKNGADPNDINPQTGDTGFHLLIQGNNIDSVTCVQLLLEFGGVPNTMNYSGKDPINEAINNDRNDISSWFTEFSKNQDIKAENNKQNDKKSQSIKKSIQKKPGTDKATGQKQKCDPQISANQALGFHNEIQESNINEMLPLELIKEEPELNQIKQQNYLEMIKEVIVYLIC